MRRDAETREAYLADAPSFILASQAPAAARAAEAAKGGAVMAGFLTAIFLLLAVVSLTSATTSWRSVSIWVVLTALLGLFTVSEIRQVRSERAHRDDVIAELARRGETPESATSAHYDSIEERLRDAEEPVCSSCGAPCSRCQPGGA